MDVYRSPSLPPDHVEIREVPSLLRAARRQAWKTVGASLLLLPLAALMTLLGACMGIPFFVLALVGLAFGLFRVFSPLGAYHELGPDRTSRLTALLRIEADLRGPSTLQVPLTKGSLFLSDDWMVLVNSSNLVVEPARQLLWFWEVTAPRKLLGLRIGSKRWINYYTESVFFPSDPRVLSLHPRDDGVLDAIARRYPHLLFGYHGEWFTQGRAALIDWVARRRAAS